MVSEILPILQLILSVGNICILGYALVKFLSKPHDSLESRIVAVEGKIEEIQRTLNNNEDQNKEQNETNQVLIHSVLALIEFEIQYCLTEHKDMSDGLKKAKEDLNSYLSRK